MKYPTEWLEIEDALTTGNRRVVAASLGKVYRVDVHTALCAIEERPGDNASVAKVRQRKLEMRFFHDFPLHGFRGGLTRFNLTAEPVPNAHIGGLQAIE
ncbi:hypothetical protein N007_04440 [Alicyclobacillus acidoterrestris ATCC 49025]|nr:hypothetical protein N007_04440 [Alicyclobacillus acidoterrestris ATCC 49025]